MTKTIWISLLLCAWNLCAQNTPLEKITSRDGLSQSMVFDLIQTRDGFLWFGTKDGLNRYDGHQFIAFKHDPFDSTSISGDIIFSLYEDSQNRIWAGTESRGINIFRRETLSFQRIQSADDGFNLSDNTVMCIAEDPPAASGQAPPGDTSSGSNPPQTERSAFPGYSFPPIHHGLKPRR